VAGRIQLQPPGLLGALQLKTLGQAPQDLGSVYAPTIECREWILNTNREWISATDAGALDTTLGFTPAGNSESEVQVPQDEWWWLHNLLAFSSIDGSTDLMVLQPAFAWDANFGRVELLGTPSPCPYPTPTTNTSVLVTAHASHCWIPPGARLGIWLHLSDVAAPRGVEIQASITRCQT